MKLDDFARYPLTFGPSPIQRLDRLTEHLGGATIWAKRDDVSSGLAFGGNKTRKLEYLLADAIGKGCDTLVSIGGVQSNHTRQVAAAAARAGLGCVLVQESWVEWPDAVYDKVGNILLSRIMGADVRLVRIRLRDRLQGELGAGARRCRGGRRQALRDPGRRLRPPARRARLRALGAGGRGAGAGARRLLRPGDRLLGDRLDPGGDGRRLRRAEPRPRRVIGIDGSAKPRETKEQVTRIAQATAALIEVGRELRADELVLDDRYHAGTYGIPDAQTIDAIRTAARLEGMLTDPVYEGKSMAGTIDLVRRGEIAKDANVLYAHLGGQPALNAYSGVF